MGRFLLVLLLLLVVGFVVLGFYEGWFNLSSSKDPETGKTNVQFQIDKDKMKSDIDKAKRKVTGAP